MDSDHSPSSPRSRSPHKSSLARAIAERRITASATYIPQDHPLFRLSSIPELPSFPDLYTPQNYEIQHTAPSSARTTNVAHDPYTAQRSAPATERLHTESISPARDMSDFIMLYATITGPPFFTPRREPGAPPSTAEFHRAWASVTYRPESVRATRRDQGRWDPLAREFHAQRTLSEAQVYDTDLRAVAVAVPRRWTHGRFWKFVRTLYSAEVCSANCVLQWVVECPVCGEEVAGYASDPLWNGRYMYHQENCCIASEQSGRA